MSKILVIETCERDLCSVTEVNSMTAAIRVANDLLEKHVEDIGYDDEFSTDPEDSGTDWALASETNSNAWSNLGDINWDCHIHTVNMQTVVEVKDCDEVKVYALFMQPLAQPDVSEFKKCIDELKAESAASNDPYDTLELLVADAIEVFQCSEWGRMRELSGDICAAQTVIDFFIEV